MRVVFFGTPSFALPTLQILLDRSEFQVIGVVSQPDRPQGRGRKLLPTPVKALAQQAQLPIWQPHRLRKSTQVLETLEALQADVFVVVAYGQILSPRVLAMPRLGCVNVHGSLLPAYRGAAPIQWSVAHGETETGITTMLMDRGMDTGDMLLQAKVTIPPDQTAGELAEILAPLGANLLAETLIQLEAAQIAPIPQIEEQATYAPLLTTQDFHLDWTRSATQLHNQIRAFYPQCFTGFQSSVDAEVIRLRILRSEPPPEHPTTSPAGQPGQVVEIVKGVGFWVKTGAADLKITQVQLAGKKAQSAWDFVNGVRLEPGRVFVPLTEEG